MRPFRDRLILALLLGLAAAVARAAGTQPADAPVVNATPVKTPASGGRPYPTDTRGSATPTAPPAGNAWFPLAVGNSWTYRCSVEGRFQFNKTLKITGVSTEGPRPLFRAEQRVGKDPQPLAFYLGVADDGSVFKTLKAAGGASDVLISAAPRIGDKLGERTVAAKEKIRVASIGRLDALRVENYPLDDPALSPERRAQWQGRFYARGFGPVAESDGLGGECLLSRAPVIVHR